VIAEAKIFRYDLYMTKRKWLRVGFSLVAILVLFQLLNTSLRSQAIAQSAFKNYCAENHGDCSAFKAVRDKSELFGHYWEFSVTTGIRPGSEPGFYRVHVFWIGTTSVRIFKERAF
jgi:hypothetical protein